ncbi:hypothetical protein P12x_001028 [Tundrisphaera lichenicola]|uniref:hypothetical protein n=1 Tax=Tundrisphaera lichenicola TaxID=2029860 RepID=UPI003EBE23C2
MSNHQFITRRVALAGLVTLGSSRAVFARTDESFAFEPTSRYEPRTIEGWPVLIHGGFLKNDPDLSARTIELLRSQLLQVIRRLPEAAVDRLRTVRIWVEEKEPHHPCMAYHPDPSWLQDHGMNPEKARCVELANARNFLRWTEQQPWMVLHELAHGYHHLVLPQGFDNPEVKAEFDRAKRDGIYDSVARVGGRQERAYAATNPMEYFAESTEAYFGKNDFFPFDRSDLDRHDPAMAKLLARIWDDPLSSP